jgi:hypothetical protein
VHVVARGHPRNAALGRWNGLSDGQRRLIILAAAAEGALKVAMLIDLKRRPASAVRGPKWLWASTVLINSAGIAPISYFVLGRVRDH